MLKLFDLVYCYEIKNGRHFLVWLARWGGSLPGQLRYLAPTGIFVTSRHGDFISKSALRCRRPDENANADA